ncbi:MAG: hypothetical protein H6822_18180 [Planctomycetaceae bacterium]|nr:hypothetical protein [Planctomycetales bacterium]MCB9924114.1 hypothetical protein [Planctomycetaceae bacterium]
MTPLEPTGRHPTDQSDSQETAEMAPAVALVDEGAFMNLTTAIQSIHFKVWVTVESSGTLRQESIPLTDERALVHAAGRLFAQGATEEAAKQIKQAQSGFNRKKAEWERRVRQSEDDSSRRRAMRELQQKKGNHNPINTRVSPAENQFRRLVEAMDVHLTLERKRELERKQAAANSAAAISEDEELIAIPAGFLDEFRTAEGDERHAVVSKYFNVEAELMVEVRPAGTQQASVTFTPALPKHRLYYIVDAAQIVRLRRLKVSRNVFYHNCLTRQNDKMTLQSVIEYVQAGGVWLLRPRPNSFQTD